MTQATIVVRKLYLAVDVGGDVLLCPEDGILVELAFGTRTQQLVSDVWLKLGLDQADYLAVAVGCVVVLVVGIIKEKLGTEVVCLRKMCLPLRWAVYYGLIFSVVIFGAYGVGYQKVDLIYAGF